MGGRRGRIAVAAGVALALVLTIGLTVNADAKKKSKSKTFEESVVVNASVPDEVAAGRSTPITSTITIPKKFKKKVVGDVNVTGIQTTGNLPSAANDLIFTLSAPSGRTVQIINTIGDQNLGPLTLDDDTPISICDTPAPPCSDPAQALNRPFAGTSNLREVGTQGSGPLSTFDGLKMRGTWTLTVWDEVSIGQTSVFNAWGLRVKPAKPVVE
jgi:subtilisin-like proprotein convertase family protein